NAPNPDNSLSWAASENTLILATAAQDSQGDILFSDPAEYISHKNNVIYFLQDDILYRRTLRAPVDDNVAATTCPADAATPTCPADKIMLNTKVDKFIVRYID